MRSTITLFVLFAVCIGCSSTANFRELPEYQTTLNVINHGWSDRIIYLLHGSQRIRLGRVTSMGEREFILPDYIPVESAPLRVVADPVGSQGATVTQEISATPGDEIQFVIMQ